MRTPRHDRSSCALARRSEDTNEDSREGRRPVSVHCEADSRIRAVTSASCSRSVESSIARVDAVPPETTWFTSSKYSVPTNAWCSVARYPRSRAASSASCSSAYAAIPRVPYSEASSYMERFRAWNPARVTNWNAYPSRPSSRWKSAIASGPSFFLQWKDGEQLYARSFPGKRSWIASAKALASARSGPDVSHQRRSANGAYASPRAIAADSPPWYRKYPSGVRSPERNGRSRASASLVISRALFASVLAPTIVGTPITSAPSRAATGFTMNSLVGTTTFPPRCPHFFAAASWSSKWTPAAPASIIPFISSNACRGPPNPGCACSTIAANQSTSYRPARCCFSSSRRNALLIRPTTFGHAPGGRGPGPGENSPTSFGPPATGHPLPTVAPGP